MNEHEVPPSNPLTLTLEAFIFGILRPEFNSRLFHGLQKNLFVAGKIFPYSDIFKWMSYGHGKLKVFLNRGATRCSITLFMLLCTCVKPVSILLLITQMESTPAAIQHTLAVENFLSHWIMTSTCGSCPTQAHMSWKAPSKKNAHLK